MSDPGTRYTSRAVRALEERLKTPGMTVKYNKCVESNKTSRENDEKKGAFVGTAERTRIPHGIVCAHLFVVFIMTSFVVCGDDTNAIRDTLSSLCSLNSVGQFGSCCQEHPTGSILFSRRDSWSCYANEMRTNNGGDLIFLFVLSSFLQNTFLTFLHRDLSSKNLTDFGEYTFSSLTNLASLFISFPLPFSCFDSFVITEREFPNSHAKVYVLWSHKSCFISVFVFILLNCFNCSDQ